MRPLIYAVVLALAAPLAAQAQTYRAGNDLNVVPLGGSTFEVIEARGEGPRGMWCAAPVVRRTLGVQSRHLVDRV